MQDQHTQYFRAVRYRASLIQRGEVEKVSVERILFSLVQGAFLAMMLSVLYWSVWHPVAKTWASVSQAFLKAST